jgi:hypothetical protein
MAHGESDGDVYGFRMSHILLVILSSLDGFSLPKTMCDTYYMLPPARESEGGHPIT